MRVKRQLVMCSDEGHEESINGIFAYPPEKVYSSDYRVVVPKATDILR